MTAFLILGMSKEFPAITIKESPITRKSAKWWYYISADEHQYSKLLLGNFLNSLENVQLFQHAIFTESPLGQVTKET